MYKNIINPIDNKKLSIYTKKGIEILKNYLRHYTMLIGGSTQDLIFNRKYKIIKNIVDINKHNMTIIREHIHIKNIITDYEFFIYWSDSEGCYRYFNGLDDNIIFKGSKDYIMETMINIELQIFIMNNYHKIRKTTIMSEPHNASHHLSDIIDNNEEMKIKLENNNRILNSEINKVLNYIYGCETKIDYRDNLIEFYENINYAPHIKHAALPEDLALPPPRKPTFGKPNFSVIPEDLGPPPRKPTFGKPNFSVLPVGKNKKSLTLDLTFNILKKYNLKEEYILSRNIGKKSNFADLMGNPHDYAVFSEITYKNIFQKISFVLTQIYDINSIKHIKITDMVKTYRNIENFQFTIIWGDIIKLDLKNKNNKLPNMDLIYYCRKIRVICKSDDSEFSLSYIIPFLYINKVTDIDKDIPIYNKYPNSSLWSCKALRYTKAGYQKQNIRSDNDLFCNINDKYTFVGDLQNNYLWPCNDPRIQAFNTKR